jgi:hypothetical protein
MGGGHALGHHHPPRIQHKLAHLGFVDRGKSDENPVVAKISAVGLHEFFRRSTDQPITLLFWKPKSHHTLVAGEGHVNDATNAKFHTPANKPFRGTRQSHRKSSYAGDGHHPVNVVYTAPTDLSNRPGSIDTKALSTAWTRVSGASMTAVNAARRGIVSISPHALRVLSSTGAYLIGIPLAIAVPALGIFAGLKLAQDPRFAGGNSPLIDAVVSMGLVLLSAFFMFVRWFGLLGALALTGFVVLAIFLLCAWLIGANVLALFRRPAPSEPPSKPPAEPPSEPLLEAPVAETAAPPMP